MNSCSHLYVFAGLWTTLRVQFVMQMILRSDTCPHAHLIRAASPRHCPREANTALCWCIGQQITKKILVAILVRYFASLSNVFG